MRGYLRAFANELRGNRLLLVVLIPGALAFMFGATGCTMAEVQAATQRVVHDQTAIGPEAGWYDASTSTVHLIDPVLAAHPGDRVYVETHERNHGLALRLGLPFGPVYRTAAGWSFPQQEAYADCLTQIQTGIVPPARPGGYGPCSPALERTLRAALANHHVTP